MFQARNVSTTSAILQLLHQHYYQLLQSSTVQLRLSNRRMFVNTVRSPTPSARVLTSGHIVIYHYKHYLQFIVIWPPAVKHLAVKTIHSYYCILLNYCTDLHCSLQICSICRCFPTLMTSSGP